MSRAIISMSQKNNIHESQCAFALTHGYSWALFSMKSTTYVESSNPVVFLPYPPTEVRNER